MRKNWLGSRFFWNFGLIIGLLHFNFSNIITRHIQVTFLPQFLHWIWVQFETRIVFMIMIWQILELLTVFCNKVQKKINAKSPSNTSHWLTVKSKTPHAPPSVPYANVFSAPMPIANCRPNADRLPLPHWRLSTLIDQRHLNSREPAFPFFAISYFHFTNTVIYTYITLLLFSHSFKP